MDDTMDVREKLVELLDNFCRDLSPFSGNEKLLVVDDNVEQAEYLIANGVTVQEWISVTERLPEKSGLYITFGCTAVPVRWLHNFDKDIGKFGAWWNYEPNGKEHLRCRFIEAENITHWMSMPDPPK